jgi:phage gp29-like protein
MKFQPKPNHLESVMRAYQFSAPLPSELQMQQAMREWQLQTHGPTQDGGGGVDSLGVQVTRIENDPDFIYTLPYVLNPDPTLARLGYSQTIPVYEMLAEDAHIAGIIQRMYAGLIRFESHVQPGGLRKVDKLAAALCEKILDRPPSPNFGWNELFFKMYEAVLYGFDLKEIVWDYSGKYLMPIELVDVPRRRVLFSPYGLPLIRTRSNFLGEPLHRNNYLLTRHRHTVDNPYGFAALSSCYWLVNFKRMVMEYYVKFIERHGSPWAIGKYPPGTNAEGIDTILNQLSNMLDSACAAVPDNVAVEFMEAKASGEKMIHSGFIDVVNSELSKAILSATLGVEITDQGSRAAATTHLEAENVVTEAHRKLVSSSMNRLFRLVTNFNFGEKVRSPYFEFYEESEANKTAAETLDIIRKYLPISLQFASDKLQVELATEGETILPGYEGEWGAEPEILSHDNLDAEATDNLEAVVTETELPDAEAQIEDGLALPNDLEHRDTVAFSAAIPACDCDECHHDYSVGPKWIDTLSNEPVDVVKIRAAKTYSRFLNDDIRKLTEIVDNADSLEDLQRQLFNFYTEPRQKATQNLAEAMTLAWLLGYQSEMTRGEDNGR